MANYSLISNATFQPFTYQELAMPLDREEAYHEKLIDEYDKLSSQADVLEAMGNNELDKNSAAYSRYKNYSDTLRKAADDLSHNGLNFESRRTLSDLRRMYSKEIVPIQNAWMKREQEAKDQITALRQNPSLMFTRDASNTRLDDYIKNPVGGYGVISGANLTAQVASMAKNLEKKILSGYKENVDDATYKYVEKYGLDAKMIADWQHNPTLSKMVEQVLAANGIDTNTLANTPNGDSILKQSMGYIEMGLWNAVGEDKSQLREDFDYRLAKETETKKSLIDYKNSGNTNNDGPTMTGSVVQLPMSGANYDAINENAKALETLGFKKDAKGNYKVDGKVKVTYGVQGNNRYMSTADRIRQNINSSDIISKARESVVNTKTIEVNLYNANGTIKTREQFLAQAGNSTAARKALNEKFNELVKAGKTLGIYGTQYTHSQLAARYNKLRNDNAASYINARALNYKPSAWNQNSLQFRAKELKTFKNGKPIYDSKSISLGNLIKEYKDTKGISPYWGVVDGKEGLILTATDSDNKEHRYFIDSDTMGNENNIQEAKRCFRIADSYRRKGNTVGEDKWTTAGMRALHAGLTLTNTPDNQALNRTPSLKQQGNLGAEYDTEDEED